MKPTKKELFEICTGVKLPWHILDDQIVVNSTHGTIHIVWVNVGEYVWPLDSLNQYINSSVFREIKFSTYYIVFVYDVLEEQRKIFKEWSLNTPEEKTT